MNLIKIDGYLKDIFEKHKIPTIYFLLLSIFFNSLMLIFRRKDAFTNPQFWAEDGFIFFSDVYHLGAKSFLKPYAGYYHLYPRIVAFLSYDFINYRFNPAIYNLSALIAVISTCLYIFKKSEASTWVKFFMCLSITFLNVKDEVFMNLTNAQWILSLNLIVFISSNVRLKGFSLILEFLFIVIVSLTGPFSLILLPLIALKSVWMILKKEKVLYILFNVIVISCAFLQYNALRDFMQVSFLSKNLQFDNFLHLLFSSYINISAFINLLAFRNNKWLYEIAGFTFLILIAGYVLLLTKKLDYNKTMQWICAVASIIFLCTLLSRMDYQIFRREFMVRYFYLPIVLLVWSFLNFFLTEGSYSRLRFFFVFFTLHLLGILFSTHRPLIDYDWKKYSQKISSSNSIIIPINPIGWKIELDKNKKIE